MMMMELKSVGTDEFTALIDTIKSSNCSISINISITGVGIAVPESTPTVVPEAEPTIVPEAIPSERKGEWQSVTGESSLQYKNHNHALVIGYNGTELRTIWKFVKQVAALKGKEVEEVLAKKYPDEASRSAFIRFLQAYMEGRVAPISSTSPMETEGNLDISPTSGSIDWSLVPAIFIGDIEYKERNGKIRLKREGTICCSNWSTIVRLAHMPSQRMEVEVKTMYPMQCHRDMICSLIDAYRQGVVCDPDEQYRAIVRIDTSTRYDGGEIGAESAY